MCENKTSKRKIFAKIALILALVTLLSVLFAGCATGTQIIEEQSKAEHWTDKTANVDLKADGFWDTLLLWVGKLLSWFTVIMPQNSYLLALFLFAIVIDLVMLPFSIKQHKNSLKQAMLRPKEMAIRNKYKGRNDQVTQQKISAEIQELYQKENYNAMAGCLPLLIQMPIIMALYYVVIDPAKYLLGLSSDFINVVNAYMNSAGISLGTNRGTIEILSNIRQYDISKFEGIKTFCANGGEVFEKIADIKDAIPNFNIGPLNFGYVPSFSPVESKYWWLLAVPVLTFIVYFFSMKINRKLTFQPMQGTDDRAAACSNNMMDITMPLLSVWICFSVPAAVGVYWIFKSIIGVVEKFITVKVAPYPVFTEEDYKAAEKEYYGKQPKKVPRSGSKNPNVRSLHHIDDEDYEDTPRAPEKPKEIDKASADKSSEDGANSAQIGQMVDGVTLKDDSERLAKNKKREEEESSDEK